MGEPTFDQLIFKASHNSYLRRESLEQQLTFHRSKTYNCGCMGIELDIWRHSAHYILHQKIDAGYFTVEHSTPGEEPLSSYFDELLKWHDANSEHHVVLITLDIKSSQGGYDGFQNEIETYLICWFREKLIFKPGSLFNHHGLTLCENVIRSGWPALSELKGKFIFCLSGNKEWKAKYAATDLPNRYCFSDRDESDSDEKVKPPTTGNIVFFNFNINHDNRAIWMKTIPPFATKHLITRSYVSNSEANWNDCIKANVSAIATDKISNTAWCKVSDSAEYRLKSQ